MSPRRAALVCALALSSCQPGEHYLLIDVYAQDDVEQLRVTLLPLDVPRAPVTETRTIARSAAELADDPLRVAITFDGPTRVLVHIQEGSWGAGGSFVTEHVATRCYSVNGVTRDEVLLVGPIVGVLDIDGDGFVGDPVTTCSERDGAGGAQSCAAAMDPYVCPDDRAADCDDGAPGIHPGARFVCLNGIDEDCDGSDEPCGDQDGDGVDACPAGVTEGCDCDDRVPEINPRAAEICNDGIDQDCDGLDACCDDDGDGSPRCADGRPDCDDTDPAINPGASEEPAPGTTRCDGIDNNCNGLIDEVGACRGPDLDGDGVAACGREEPGQPCDCNDCDAAIFQGAREICGNGIDEDCDGTPDDGCPATDADGDGFAPPTDCDDTDPFTYPARREQTVPDRCGDGVAQNCIPGEDRSCEQDLDGDGWVEPPDCEGNPAISPATPEIPCNGVDDDCDGVRDEVLMSGVGCIQEEDGMGGTRPRMIAYATDFSHCGACRNDCPTRYSDTCVDDACRCAAAGVQCAANETCCSGTGCFDLLTHPGNCGACGRACGTGESCVGGQCTCGPIQVATGEACPDAGNVCCGATCRNLPTDDANCGQCGLACGSNSACSSGSCTCTSADWDDCNRNLGEFGNDGCETLVRGSDVNNCGACGARCGGGQATWRCSAGVCAIASCNAGWSDCDGRVSNGCETLITTPTDCVTCGNVCDSVVAPDCRPGLGCGCGLGGPCSATQRCCGGRCVPRTDTSNCGGCGRACDPVVADSCNGTSCRCGSGPECGASERCCGGTCVPRASTMHCGGCGAACDPVVSDRCNGTSCRCGSGPACSATQRCCGGSCVSRTSTMHCGGCGMSCDAVTTDTCNGTSCRCGSGAPCGGSERCCGGTCVPRTSTMHCGGCGAACDASRADSCNGTDCRCGSGPQCTGGQRCCSGACVPRTDLDNCGACGSACDRVVADGCSGTACTCGLGPQCSGTQRCCAGTCVPRTSTMHCGGCAMLCDPARTDSCDGTSCRCGSGPPCSTGQVCCPGGVCMGGMC